MKSHFVVVMTDGRVYLCSSDLTETVAIQAPAVKGHVTLSFFLRSTNSLHLFLLCDNTSPILHIIEVSPSPVTARYLRSFELPEKDARKIHASFLSASDRQLFLLREDCTWQAWRWPSTTAMVHQAPELGISRSLKTFAAPTSHTVGKRRKSGSSATEQPRGLLAVPYRSSIVMIAGTSNGKPTLTFWDTHFGTLLGSQVLLDDATTSERIVSVCSSADHKWVVVAFESRIVACPVHCPPSSLSFALGRLPATAALADNLPTNPPASAALTLQKTEIEALLSAPAVKSTSSGADITLDDALWDKMLCKHDQEEKAVLAALQSSNITSAKFSELFDKYVTSTKKEEQGFLFDPTTSRKKHARAIVKNIERERKLQRQQREAMAEAGLSEHFVVTAGVIALKAHYWAPLEYLIRSGCLYAQTLPGLFSTLLEQKRLDLLFAALSHMPDIPEVDLVLVLRFIINVDAQLMAEFANKHRKTTTKAAQREDATAGRAILFRQLLHIPRNEVFLTQQLRDLSAAEVDILLEYLFARYEEQVASQNSLPHGDLLDWLCVIVDAHLPYLLAHAKWSERAEGIRERVRDEAQACELAVPVHSFLETIISGKRLPLADVPDYRVEKIHF